MSYQKEHKEKFAQLRDYLQEERHVQLKLKANGGNSVLFIYPPEEEAFYLNKLAEANRLPAIQIINIAELLTRYIDQEFKGWDSFTEHYEDYKDTPNVVFNSEDEGEVSLMTLILSAIEQAVEAGKIPVLVRTGALYGTGIENVMIMEHNVVMKARQPLVIFYPSKQVGEDLYFLNAKQASKYRCVII